MDRSGVPIAAFCGAPTELSELAVCIDAGKDLVWLERINDEQAPPAATRTAPIAGAPAQFGVSMTDGGRIGADRHICSAV
jgi:hypothetical protein